MVKHLKITVEGKIYDVVVEDVTEDAGSTFYQSPSAGMPAPGPRRFRALRRRRRPLRPPAVRTTRSAPLAGVIIEISGQRRPAGQGRATRSR